MSIDLRDTSARVTYSFVIPVHNEQAVLPALRERLVQALALLDGDAEVIFVDDGSTDLSWTAVTAFHAQDHRFKGVRLSRNFGHQVAITAGMDLAAGQAVVVMDADLQDPPEVVLEMAARWRDGYEVVYGLREDRSTDSRFKRTTARAFYRILGRLTDVDIPEDVGDFRLIDRRALEAFLSMREGSRFVRGMFAWIGFRQVGVPYRRDARYAGETKYPIKKMVRLAGDGVIGFSRVPLRIALKLGTGAAPRRFSELSRSSDSSCSVTCQSRAGRPSCWRSVSSEACSWRSSAYLDSTSVARTRSRWAGRSTLPATCTA